MKLSSISIISAASLVTSVQVIHIHIPISAILSAGASLTQSPVIATICHCDWRSFTMVCLCAGFTLAKTQIWWIILVLSSVFSKSSPVIALPGIQSCLAIAVAVMRLSHVIMMTLIPAVSHLVMASLTSSLGGSIIACSQTNIRSFSWSVYP